MISDMMRHDSLLTITPMEASEPWNRLRDTLAGFQGSGGINLFAAWPQIGDHPGFRRDLVLLVRREQRLIGGMLTLASHLRLGESRIRTALLLPPVVHPAFAGYGLGSTLLEHAWQMIHRKGFLAAWSAGNPLFEQKHGFVHPYPARETVLVYRRSVLPPSSGRMIIRALRPSDLSFLRSLHERTEQRAWGSFLRASGHYAFFWDAWRHCRIVSNVQGLMIGFYLPDAAATESLDILECGVVVPEHYGSLCGLIRRHAGDLGRSTVRFFLAPWHAFPSDPAMSSLAHSVKSLPRLGGKAGGFAVVNIPDMLEGMIPEWEYRLAQVFPEHAGAECTLVVEKEKNPWIIRTSHGAVSVSPGMGGNRLLLTRAELAGLIIGSYSGDEWVEQRAPHLDSGGAELVRTLFLTRTPYAWKMDRPERFTRSMPDDHWQDTDRRTGHPDQ